MPHPPFPHDHPARPLFEAAERLGLSPVYEGWSGAFSIQTAEGFRLVSWTRTDLNSQLGAWTSKNKIATHRLLDSHGIATIPWYAGLDTAALDAFRSLHGTTVAKPREGHGGQGLRLLSPEDPEEADPGTIYEKYIVGDEYRHLVLRGRVIGVQRRVRTGDDPWIKSCANLPSSEWRAELVERSVAVAGLMRLGWAAVDYLVDSSGQGYVMETNSMVGLQSFHVPDIGEPNPVGEAFLRASFP